MGCKIYRGLVFIMPLLYSIQTRFLRRSKLGLIVWATEYLIPVMLAMLILNICQLNLLHALFAIVAVYNLYEVGYIQNDCETIKHEEKPTRRLSEDDLSLYEKWKSFIYLIRLFWGVLFTWYFYKEGVSIIGITIMWLVIPYYVIYNYLRGRVNLFLLLPLTGYRYCFPIYLYNNLLNYSTWNVILCLFIAYPLPTFIEICADGKGNPPEKWTKFFLENFEDRFAFRIKYYIVLLLMFVILATLGFVSYWITIIPLYYFLDRLPQLKMKKLGDK